MMINSVSGSGSEWGMMRSRLMGELDISWGGKTMGGGYCIISKWVAQIWPTKLHNGDGGGRITSGWWGLFKGNFGELFHSRQKMEEVQRTYARLGEEIWKRGWRRGRRRGWLEEEVEGLPSCVRARDVKRRGLVSRSLSK